MLSQIIALLVLLAGCATPPPPGTKLIKMACPATEIVTYTPEAWSGADQRAYELAGKRCRYYYSYSPCLKRFIRMEQLRYRAWCGNEVEMHMFDLEYLP